MIITETAILLLLFLCFLAQKFGLFFVILASKFVILVINKYNIGTTLVATGEIIPSSSSSRRTDERQAVRRILDEIVGANVALEHDATGAPKITGYNISISHSRKLAVVAIDPCEKIGVDAEEWRPTLSRVKSKFLSAEEVRLFVTNDQLLRAWTIKEAVYKIVGQEATVFSESIAINPPMSHATCLNTTFSIYAFDVGDTFISLAKASQNKNVKIL